jgi:hypothetical protein
MKDPTLSIMKKSTMTTQGSSIALILGSLFFLSPPIYSARGHE